MNFRKLKADEIEARIATVTKNKKSQGVSLLLYKDSRTDMRLLDETVGMMNWQKKYDLIDGQLFCSVGIWDAEKQQWIWKQDVGTESYTEKEKGRASDSFKRACFNLGIGRELYTAPFIWVKDCEISEGKNGNFVCYDRFAVTDIGYDDEGRINRLVIENSKTHDVVYTMGTRSNHKGACASAKPKNDAPTDAPEDAPELASDEAKERFNAFHSKLKERGAITSSRSQIMAQAGYKKGDPVTADLIGKAMVILMEADHEAR